MKYKDLVSFRRDLLFNGAVQISWFENDIEQAHKAAEHFVFHGPAYRGIAESEMDVGPHQLVDTATFTLDLVKNITENSKDEPFALAIAGYGTGKSHLGVTLASLLSEPQSEVAKKILQNVHMADPSIGRILSSTLSSQPFLVVVLNGMQDFELTGELIRQILHVLKKRGLDTTALENLKPRFKAAIRFTESFFNSLETDFRSRFGADCTADSIVASLKLLDEEAYRKVSAIYEQKMDGPLASAIQESLGDFLRVVSQNYCGNGKPFAGVLIIFDEFGRYLEFSVQKPHIAGSGALQKIYESVQANRDFVFLLNFIQYELKAYISRVAPEFRNELSRYLYRYENVRKVRLSTNLETLIANLIEKKNAAEIDKQTRRMKESPTVIWKSMQKWFPDMRNHKLWQDYSRFNTIICQGCWPLHPMATWALYKLSSVGKTLQKRSALSLLDEVLAAFENKEIGASISLSEICNDSLVQEFLAAEVFGQQGALAHAYEAVRQKYTHELSANEILILKAVLVSGKIGIKVDSRDEYLQALAMFVGLEDSQVAKSIRLLESEYAVLEWNEILNQFEITGDAVPRAAFIAELENRVRLIDSKARAELFSQNFKRWAQKEKYNTDFGSDNQITTQDWHYKIHYTHVAFMESQIQYALRSWKDALEVDDAKGQLIYCYVGPESNLQAVSDSFYKYVKSSLEKMSVDWKWGAPLAVIFIHDEDGYFGHKMAEYWTLTEKMAKDGEAQRKYRNFILDKESSCLQEMMAKFTELEAKRLIYFATEKEIVHSRVSRMLKDLFNVIYPKRVPFYFDGFHTARGNAAKDCQLFTKELFRGTLDKEWIVARIGPQKDRAYAVLDKSWGIFADDGTVKIKPKNVAVRVIIEYLEACLQGETNENKDNTGSLALNMGSAVRQLCAPPFGCNMASAGMLLAYFIGRRKQELSIYKNGEVISIENWLSEAIPKYFLDISVLDSTIIQKVSGKALSEWEVLLDEWESEISLKEKVRFLKKSQELNERISIPPQLFHRYKLLKQKAEDAILILNTTQRKIDEARNKIEKGIEENNKSMLSWGAAELQDIYNNMDADHAIWGERYIKQVSELLAYARLQTQKRFPEWLKAQTVKDIERLERFKFVMVNKVGSYLASLGLDDELKMLKDHVSEVEKNVKFFVEMKSLSTDISFLIQNCVLTSTTPLSVLNVWLGKAADLHKRLDEARSWPHLVQNDILDERKKLKEFEKACIEQIDLYHKRMQQVYKIEDLSSDENFEYWKKEICALLAVCDNNEHDIEDLKKIQKYLEFIETHRKKLYDENLNEEDFVVTCDRCMEETAQYFTDKPPLDSKILYKNLFKAIRSMRERAALDWIRQNVPDIEDICTFDAIAVTQIKNILLNAPRILSKEKLNSVRSALEACDKRLDELEVEGLIAKFTSLSDEGKKQFLKMIGQYLVDFSFSEEEVG